MPAYPIPPWLQPYGDPGALVLQARHQSAAIAAEKQRLQQQQQQAAMENETRQEIAAQRAREEAQQLEVDRARVTAEVGLKSRQLDMAQSKLQETATVAAHRYSAQQQMSQRIAAGEDPAHVALTIPDLGLPGGGIAALARSTVPKPNIAVEGQWKKSPSGADYYINPKSGAPHFEKAAIPEGLTKRDADKFMLGDLSKEKAVYLKAIASDPAAERYATMTDDEIKAASDDKDLVPGKIAKKKAALAIHKKLDAIDQKRSDILAGKSASTPAKSGRVKVKSPQGKVGSIPAEQLDEALKSGYTEVSDARD